MPYQSLEDLEEIDKIPWKKFMVARNPIERVVSAWHNFLSTDREASKQVFIRFS